jgi:putative two-component system response regulator
VESKILVVDDDVAICEFYAGVLRREGYDVVFANDGHAALEAFAQHHPDLVLLDVMICRLDGFEVCRRIKKNPEGRLNPVVLVTGLSATEHRVKGIEAGADDFLVKPVDDTELLARVRSLLSRKADTDELERAESVLFALARTIEGKDPCTAGHCERLSDHCEQLGRRIGPPEQEITALRRAAIVRDIGKVAVPDAILLKPSKLTDSEWKIMQQHPLLGERICAPLKSFRQSLGIVRHHHERLDGTGYPDRLTGDQIPLMARVLTIADVYDALASTRPYRYALSSSRALEVMADEVRKGWWDPRVFAEFRELNPEGHHAPNKRLFFFHNRSRTRQERGRIAGATESALFRH